MAISLPKLRERLISPMRRIVMAQEFDHLPRRIVAAVIDIDRFPRAQRVHRGDEALMEARDRLGLIERGHHDGEGRAAFPVKMRRQDVGHGKVR